MSNYIIINEANKAKIEEILNNVQKRASVRLVKLSDIYSFVEKINKYKDNHNISMAALENCKFSFDSYQTMPNSYDYKISFTCVSVIIENGKYRIASIFRASDFNKRHNAHKAQATFLTEKAKQALIENASYM